MSVSLETIARYADTREMIWLDALPADHKLKDCDYRIEGLYRGWGFFWTGWKVGPIAQWCGSRIRDLMDDKPIKMAYACFPGGCGFIGRGEKCDSRVRKSQEDVLRRMKADEPGIRDQVRDSELQRFLRFIDSLEDAACSNA